MNQIALVAEESNALPLLIDRAARALAGARSSAEVLEAQELAAIAYDAAKRAARFARAKGAHDTLIAAVHRAQADALEIEARAKRRLADEYDAAQERGEVARIGDNLPRISGRNSKPTSSDIGINPRAIYEAREIRDAEEADPGIVSRTLKEAVEAGQEPTRAKVKRAVQGKSKRRRHARQNHNSPTESQHDRDLRMLLGVWESACDSARREFIATVS